MGHSTRMVRAAALSASVAIGIFSVFAAPADAASNKDKSAASQPADAAAQKQQAAAAAKNNYENGVKQYQAGKYPQAVENLSAALRGGGLASTDMARALYFRGIAYKKQSKPGLAISDLTSALWLKNGLNDADRASATAERAEAYRMAGLGDGNTGGESVAVADPNAGAAATPAPATSASAPVAAPPVVVEAKPAAPAKKGKKNAVVAAAPPPVVEPQPEITRQSPDSPAAQDAARARQMAAAPVDAGGLQSIASASVIGTPAKMVPSAAAPAAEAAAVASPPAAVTVAAAPVAPMAVPKPDAAPVLAAAPVGETPAAAPSATGGSTPIGNFFSNLFSGSSGSQQAAASGDTVTTASTTPQPQTSSWNESTSVAAGAAAKTGAPAKAVKQAAAAQSAPVQAAPAVAAAPAVSGGKYKIHIAAVRSREEAEAIAQKVQSQGGASLKSRTASVDEAVIGSMGKFYRVRVGSYATADEPRGVCNALRSSGFDCLVVTN